MSAGNGRGTMRPNNRSPPFLVVGLLVAMCILAFNYWNLSSRNRDLSSQLEGLQVDFRSVSDRHLTVEKRAADLSSQLAELQSRLNLIQNSASEKDNKVHDLNGEVESLKNQLQTSHQKAQEAQSNMQQVLQEKTSVNEELEKVKSQLNEEQKRETVCDKIACHEVLHDVLKTMVEAVGKSAVTAALSPHHADVLLMIKDLVQGVQEPQRQQNPQNPHFPAPGDGQQQQPGGQTQLQLQAQRQNFNMGQNPNMGQVPNMVPDPSVVQMQLPGAPGDQAAVGQDGGAVKKPQQQQPLNVLQQLPEVASSLDLHKPMPQGQGGVADPKEEEKGGEQEIVAQNIPRREGEEAAVSNNNANSHSVNEIIAAPAQEDVGDDHHLDLPEDEIDRQAAANHGAGELSNLDDNLHNQLQDLSKNEVDEGDNEDKLEEQEGKEDIDLNGVDEERRVEEDYDEDNVRRMEGDNKQTLQTETSRLPLLEKQKPMTAVMQVTTDEYDWFGARSRHVESKNKAWSSRENTQLNVGKFVFSTSTSSQSRKDIPEETAMDNLKLDDRVTLFTTPELTTVTSEDDKEHKWLTDNEREFDDLEALLTDEDPGEGDA